ncbi:MAG TPA: M28 family peptidase [Anaerolineales bacterium]|nr:M28 family peptidase [Anaerolineales bacterium]
MNSRFNKKHLIFGFGAFLLLFSAWGVYYFGFRAGGAPSQFDGDRALEDVRYQTGLGPRVPGSEAHTRVIDWITSELAAAGWRTSLQDTAMMGHPVKNIIARRPSSQDSDLPWIIVGAHYDSRLLADQDREPSKRSRPVPGANDGASGVAVLMELARILPRDLQKNVWLVFFDAEDNGNIPSWDWILGSRAFVDGLQGKPDAAIIVDMIGDADLNIYMERNSTPTLSVEIWKQAADLGYSAEFIPVPKYNMLDDHTPFLQAGIPAADLIDFDYPYWHTTEDTVDKVSARSLQIVGQTLATWLVGNR